MFLQKLFNFTFYICHVMFVYITTEISAITTLYNVLRSFFLSQNECFCDFDFAAIGEI